MKKHESEDKKKSKEKSTLEEEIEEEYENIEEASEKEQAIDDNQFHEFMRQPIQQSVTPVLGRIENLEGNQTTQVDNLERDLEQTTTLQNQAQDTQRDLYDTAGTLYSSPSEVAQRKNDKQYESSFKAPVLQPRNVPIGGGELNPTRFMDINQMRGTSFETDDPNQALRPGAIERKQNMPIDEEKKKYTP